MKRPLLVISAVITAVLLLAWLIFYVVYWRFIETTGDAYVNGNQVVVTSQVQGFVQNVYVQDTQLVHAGELIAQLDPTDAEIALGEAKEKLGNAVRTYIALVQKVDELKADKQVKASWFVRTGQDYQHRQELIDSGAISVEDFQHAEADFVAAFASVLLVEHQLKAAEAQVANTTLETHPLVAEAIQLVRQAYVNLKRCKILAPASGMVARKAVQVGQSIAPSDTLLLIIPFDQVWVDANFKEVQLKNVRPGAPATVRADYYGHSVVFHGTVLDINAGTGSVFSVLPPQNATGNWIKIVQRLATRILLDPEEVKKHPLRLGLSMEVKIDVRSPLEDVQDRGYFETPIFQDQLQGVDELIAQVIEENSQWKK